MHTSLSATRTIRSLVHACALTLGLFSLAAPSRADDYTVLKTFTGLDGATPFGSLIALPDGTICGTTSSGGPGYLSSAVPGSGTIFQIDTANGFSTRYAFTGAGIAGGGLIADALGNLYGDTSSGGPNGFGAIFRLAPDNTYTVIHSFWGIDGLSPDTNLLRDAQGTLYGACFFGGASFTGPYSGQLAFGTVYKQDALGNFTVLHSFDYTKRTDGYGPTGSLHRDAYGNLYGTTVYGGGEAGIIYKITPAGKFILFHDFIVTEGLNPFSGVVTDGKGNFYGTCANYGTLGYGTLWKCNSLGKVTVLHQFSGGADGASPLSSLVFDSAGNLYGTTVGHVPGDYLPPSVGLGTLFKFSNKGGFTTVHTFTGGADGANPLGIGYNPTTNALYGVTENGGPANLGTVYRYNP